MVIFRRRVLEVRAVRWLGDNVEEAAELIDPAVIFGDVVILPADSTLHLESTERSLSVPSGWWILRDGSEFYTCSDEMFRAFFEAIDGQD